MSGIINTKGSVAKILYRGAMWHLRRYTSGRAFPLIATFQLTNRCNLKCVMCNIVNNPAKGVLPLEEFKKILHGLKRAGCCFASLSGGEVLTIPDFFEYAAEARAAIPSVNMVTNGLLLDKAAALEIRKSRIDSVSVSLDGMEATHELTRGRAGAFNKTVEAIELVKRHAPGVRVVVNTVIAPWNLKELKELVVFVEALGVSHKFQPLNEHPAFEGQSVKHPVADKSGFDPVEVKDLTRFLLKQKNVANSAYFLRAIPGYLSGNGAGPGARLFTDRCRLPEFYCEFREDGLMYPCLGGTNWKGGYPVGPGVDRVFASQEYTEAVRRLKACRGCTRSYSVCYIEPRVVFPLGSFLKYRLLSALTQAP